MTILLDVGDPRSTNRTASVTIAPHELSTARLIIASAGARNRSSYYMRRHPKLEDRAAGIQVGPNAPLCSDGEPEKLTIVNHLRVMKRVDVTSRDGMDGDQRDSFSVQPAQIVVPVSDIAANLLRPCYARQGLGKWKTFFFEDEPIDRKTYWTACLFDQARGTCGIRFMDLVFDVRGDTVRSLDGQDLSTQGLEWAVALVPLVKNGVPASIEEIAIADYDLRQIFGRASEPEICAVYEGWYDEWEERVTNLVAEYRERKREFETFYHSVLSIHASGTIHIRQTDATLPQLAQSLAGAGMVSAGLLDSGGSCALFDPWLQGYLNHGWYFREPRGAVICFELRAMERLPRHPASSWFRDSS